MTRRSYTRDDVQMHSDGFRESYPAVNVKVYTDIRDKFAEYVKQEQPDARFTLDWIEENVRAESLDAIFWNCCEWEFEYTADYAEEIFGEPVKCERQGRSGGWLVVTSLPDIEDWDAVRLAKWRKFERVARNIADYIPYSMLSSLYLNEFEIWADEQEDASSENSELPVDEAFAS